MRTIDEMCDVMQAFKSGKPVQSKCHATKLNYPWYDDADPIWNWGINDYRVTPEPRVFWIVEWPTRWHVYQSLDCAIAASRRQIGDVPGQVIRVLEVLDGEA